MGGAARIRRRGEIRLGEKRSEEEMQVWFRDFRFEI